MANGPVKMSRPTGRASFRAGGVRRLSVLCSDVVLYSAVCPH